MTTALDRQAEGPLSAFVVSNSWLGVRGVGFGTKAMRKPTAALAIAGAHIAGVLLLWQATQIAHRTPEQRSLMVAVIHEPASTPQAAELPVPPQPTAERKAAAAPTTVVAPVPPHSATTAADSRAENTEPSTLAMAPAAEYSAPASEPRPVTVLAIALPHDPPRPPPQVSINAVQYRVLPPVELPRASRRAGESGTVWLRVRVDVTGAPAVVSLHRSSGHARLDEQALWAMRQARFRPYAEDSRALEVEVIAPVEYPAA